MLSPVSNRTTLEEFVIDSVGTQRRRHRVAERTRRRYAGTMSERTAELLEAFEAFEALSPDEKRIFTAEFLRRAIPFDSGPLEDEETAHAADSLFALLDAEENDTASR